MSVRFFLQNPSQYSSHFDETWEVNLWTAEGGATITRTLETGDADHPYCMKVVSDTDGKGVYYDVENLDDSTQHVVEFSYLNDATQEIDYEIYDQDNSASIDSGTLVETVWSNLYLEFDTPANCNTVRIFLRAGTNTDVAFYIDDIKLQGNAILRDPDRYETASPQVQHAHTIQDGSEVVDVTTVMFHATLEWPILEDSQFQRLLEFVKQREACYFDDQNVPDMVDTGYIWDDEDHDFVGITNPSGTHIARYDSDSSLPSAKTDFDSATEFSTANYQAVDADDDNDVETSASTNRDFVYHQAVFQTAYATIAEIQSLDVLCKAAGIDESDNGAHGVIMYMWNGTTWIKMDESVTSDKATLSYSTSHPEQAQDYVDVDDGVVRVLLRTRTHKGSSGALKLQSYYIRVQVNKGLSTAIALTNKAIPDATGAIVHAKDITQGLTLAQGIGYRLSDDREAVQTYQSLDLNAADGEYVTISDDASLDLTTAITLEAWIRPDSTIPAGLATTNRTVLAKQNAYNLIWVSGTTNPPATTLYFTINFVAAGGVTVIDDLTPGEWNHVVGTWESGSKLKLYLNGTLIDESGSTYTDTITTNAEDVYTGWDSASDRYFAGLVGLARIYKIAVTQADVTWLYANPRATLAQIFANTTATEGGGGSDDDVVLYHDYDGGLTDLSEYGNDGTHSGTAAYLPATGDRLEAKYSQYLLVRCTNSLPEQRYATTDSGAATPGRSATMILKSVLGLTE